ncbi:MAG: CYTH domain-containing protein [Bacteroidota bacterium]
MGIRKSGILVLFTIAFTAAFSQTENQRKYLVEDYKGVKAFIQSSQSTENLSTYFHSDATYYDLYLDTPDFLLLKNRMSLRLRKRIISKKKRGITYAFQLKTEMDSLNGLRMEIEETELDFYLLKSGDEWIPMSVLLDSIFYQIDQHPEAPLNPQTKEAFELITFWIQFKAGGAIAPFQKLLYLGFSLEEIQRLRPMSSGRTRRLRSHIYSSVEQTERLGIRQNRVKRNKISKFFKEKPENNWLQESSLDQSTFVPLFSTEIKEVSITEYEVENKYYLEELGKELMDIYEKELSTRFNMSPKLDSKYRQLIQLFEVMPK